MIQTTGERTYLRQGQLVPNWRFISPAGTGIQPGDYRQRVNLVIVFAGDKDCERCRALLKSLAVGDHDIRDQDARVLAVVAGSPQDAREVQERDDLPYAVVADEGGRVHREVGALGEGPGFVVTVLVADRFGEIYSIYREDKYQPVPTAGEIIAWLQFIELQCPE